MSHKNRAAREAGRLARAPVEVVVRVVGARHAPCPAVAAEPEAPPPPVARRSYRGEVAAEFRENGRR